MSNSPIAPAERAVAVVGVGAVLPDAPNANAFWDNVTSGRDSIRETPADRWLISDYYDPDPAAPGKTYSKIGGWATAPEFESAKYRIPPKVAAAMDDGQKWAVLAAGEALRDAGHPDRPLDTERTGVIVGAAMGGERHYASVLPLSAPEYQRALAATRSFAALPEHLRAPLLDELRAEIMARFPETTEDTMPGELTNIMAGRIASVFNLRGPNYITDAACASSLAALEAAINGLIDHHYDAVISGGMDRNMGASTFIKFCKIGALSPDGSRPYADGANGFVMGEGGAMFVLKRLADAERDGDRVYAVIRGIGASSDGKGKGITAPNPVGQPIAIRRAWERAGESPATMTLLEGHGTSTRVGDVVEIEAAAGVLAGAGLRPRSVALGSIKSQIGHLKSGAGAAGMLKAVLAAHHKVLPPSINFHAPNPNVDFDKTPFFVPTQAQPWERPADSPRRVGVSSFGFGGTNFHVVVEEHVPGLLTERARRTSVQVPAGGGGGGGAIASGRDLPSPHGDLLALGGADARSLREQLGRALDDARSGRLPPRRAPGDDVLRSHARLVIAFDGAEDLIGKGERALRAFDGDNPTAWRLLRSKGVHFRTGTPGKVAFLFPGQGSQYVNMLAALREVEPIVAETFAEADEVMAPILGRPLTSYLFNDTTDPAVKAEAEAALRDTTICQPAVLSCDVALTRLFRRHGIEPDFAMGHSLGEWGAVVASDMLPFADALLGVCARAKGMASVSLSDPGKMASVLGPADEIVGRLSEITGYITPANFNSSKQTVIAGASDAIERAVSYFNNAGFTAQLIPVSHAFHSEIVAPASTVMSNALLDMDLRPPRVPVVSNVDGDFYPDNDLETTRAKLSRQLASSVRFVDGLETLYRAGARVFLEVGPKRVLQGFAEDVLGDREGVMCLSSNHPKRGDIASFHEAMCGLYAAGLPAFDVGTTETTASAAARDDRMGAGSMDEPNYLALGKLFADFLEQGMAIYKGGAPAATRGAAPQPHAAPAVRGSVVVSGAGLGLPGAAGNVFDDANVERILRGESFLGQVPEEIRGAMVDKNIVRLHKRDVGEPSLEPIASTAEVIKLAARRGAFDLAADFGIKAERTEAYDITTSLAIAAGLEALRDAGIPLIRHYRKTTTGSRLPDRWRLPLSMSDETGIIFASAFPGVNFLVDHLERYHSGRLQRALLDELVALRRTLPANADAAGLDAKIAEIERAEAESRYTFDRRFLFQILSMGHSQFAELIGARGPNTQVNSACASTTQAIAIAEDWIRAGRCRRVLVIGADDVTSDTLLGWIGSGFLASGAATTEEVVERAALPFDRRRHGMLLGMGACGLVVEDQDSLVERGMRGLVEVIATETANSAFHGTRLDVGHIGGVMERLVGAAEKRTGVARGAMARKMVFVSHETYTPARGGSAAAEVHALRDTFGADADAIVVANTKGFTGHPQGVGIEDAIAVKILENQQVPPVPNFREPDPELGQLNLSRGGHYDVEYALRLAAGFGSQVSMSLTRRVAGSDERVADRAVYERWLAAQSGQPTPQIEVVNRTLRIADAGAPEVEPAESTWRYGDVPTAVVAGTPAVAPVAAAPRPVAPAPAPKPVAPAPQPVGAAPAPEPEPGAGDAVADKVLAVVSEKTGYPPDMLALDLDLEADLGIDTVKQAEVFAMVREQFGIPPQDGLKLSDYPTLQHVIGFVREHRPELAAAPAPTPAAAAPTPTAPPASDDVADKVLAVVSEKTGYPPDMLDLDLDLEADLGIDTVKQAEVFAMVREQFGIPPQDGLKLSDYPTLQHVIGFVREHRPELAAPAAAPEAPAPAPAATTAPATDEVADTVLAVVSEKTGYPPDMLDLDLDLEADLGIDTVKQAEVFAMVREAFGIPPQDGLKLSDYPTLQHVIGFVREHRPAAQAAAPMATPAQTATATPDETGESGRELVRIPVPTPRPALGRCAPTAVDLTEGRRVVVVCDRGGVGARLATALERLGLDVLRVEDRPDPRAFETLLAGWASAGSVAGIYFLAGLDAEPPLVELDLDGWRTLHRERIGLLHAASRTLYDALGQPGAFLVAGTRLGGVHGYDWQGARNPSSGAVTGFVKALARERGDALVKVVDFSLDAEVDAIADALLSETRRDPGAVEIGYRDELRYSIGVVPEPEAPVTHRAPMTLDDSTVFLVTGGAGAVTSAIVRDLATASRGTFHLLDARPLPDDQARRDMQRLASDRAGLQREIFERMKAAGERATPAEVEKRLFDLERGADIIAALKSVEKAGGSAHYHSVDVTDAGAIRAVVGAIRDKSGRLDVIVHAAGLERSRGLDSKPVEEFDLVFGVKSDGLFNLLKETEDLAPRALVCFSSVAGRFGNAGQTDYSAGNDLMCKLASRWAAARTDALAVTFDWTAWGGIGMATRGNIPELMRRAGIEMLDPTDGIPLVRRALTEGLCGEAVVGRRLGILLDPPAPGGGVDADAIAHSRQAEGLALPISSVTVEPRHGLSVEVALDPSEQPFLYDHEIDGTPVLPGVFGLEAFAEVASLLTPGWRVAAIEDVEFLAPMKYFRREPRPLVVRARVMRDAEGALAARMTLLSTQQLVGDNTVEKVHFVATVRLARADEAVKGRTVEPRIGNGARIDSDAIYRVFFHGPAFQVLSEARRTDGDGLAGALRDRLPPETATGDARCLFSPRLVELCFQTAGVWEIGSTGQLGLPAGAERVAVRQPPDGIPLVAEVVARDGEGGPRFDAWVRDDDGRVYVDIKGYRTSRMPGALPDEQTAAFRKVVGRE